MARFPAVSDEEILDHARADIGPEALACAALAMLTGDVAQRFVARKRTLAADPAFIAAVVRLVSAR